jgi:ketosteroid isomerase-like protein
MSADDYEAIRRLSAEYNLAFDYKDLDGYLRCWTEDGYFERSNAGRGYRGTAELTEVFSTYDVDGRHITTNFIIDLDGDTARESAFLTYIDRASNWSVHMFGVYADELVRTADGWRYSSRRLQVDV